MDSKSRGDFKGIEICQCFKLSPLLFVENILVFFEGNISHIESLKYMFWFFINAIGMKINHAKFSIIAGRVAEMGKAYVEEFFSKNINQLGSGLKYPRFYFKTSNISQIGIEMAFGKYEKESMNWKI